MLNANNVVDVVVLTKFGLKYLYYSADRKVSFVDVETPVSKGNTFPQIMNFSICDFDSQVEVGHKNLKKEKTIWASSAILTSKFLLLPPTTLSPPRPPLVPPSQHTRAANISPAH